MKAKRSEMHGQELTEARVLAICSDLQETLGLEWQDIRHHFSSAKADDQATTCETDATWKYRYARLTWNLDQCAGATDQQILEVAVHEYVHVLMGPIKDHLPVEDHVAELEEFTTESIARVILKLLDSQ